LAAGYCRDFLGGHENLFILGLLQGLLQNPLLSDERRYRRRERKTSAVNRAVFGKIPRGQ
ncbi:MAG: hypothetical protein NT176_19975, partial [Proteobacteria bacterium]|nr:hypothetical protein [Pseudomonadota bacterium]